ncbi:MAG: HD domain-containing protein [Firmicutes bacterium]|nr:HD domain-containing protein [Bacillota bacterium]
MNYEAYIDFLGKIEKLKCNTRHSWSSCGRRESVAEHSWRLAVMAMLCHDEYPELDMDKVIKMCLIHDFGEAVTGDIPSFDKTDDDEETEKRAVAELVLGLPNPMRDELTVLFNEINEMKTPEAKLFKALDNMEAVLSHNEAPLSTWTELEYSENLIYGENTANFSEWTKGLRRRLKADSEEKLRKAVEHK